MDEVNHVKMVSHLCYFDVLVYLFVYMMVMDVV